MKKGLFLSILGLTTLLFAASCNKSDTTTSTNSSSPEGRWSGTVQYGTTGGTPTYPFSLTFKSNGTVDVTGYNGAAADNGTGTWQLVQDSVKVTYSYAGSSAVYASSSKYSSGSNVMTGTFGLSPVTSGQGVFSVTKQ